MPTDTARTSPLQNRTVSRTGCVYYTDPCIATTVDPTTTRMKTITKPMALPFNPQNLDRCCCERWQCRRRGNPADSGGLRGPPGSQAVFVHVQAFHWIATPVAANSGQPLHRQHLRTQLRLHRVAAVTNGLLTKLGSADGPRRMDGFVNEDGSCTLEP